MALRALLAVACFIPALAAADATALFALSSGNWVGGAYSDRETGAFSHCSLTASYESGVIVTFGIDSGMQMYLGLAEPSWELGSGMEYTVELLVDWRSLGHFSGVANEQVLLLPLGTTTGRSDVYRKLRDGYILQVRTAKTVLHFNLTGTHEAFPKVAACSQLASSLSAPSTNPFASTSKNPFGETRHDPAADVRETLGAFLRSAGVQDLAFVEPASMQFDDAAFAWTFSEGAGYLFAFGRSGESMEDSIGQFLGGMTSGCEGYSASGSKPTRQVGQYEIKEGFMSCDAGEDAAFTAFTLVADRASIVVIGNASVPTESESIQKINTQLANLWEAFLR